MTERDDAHAEAIRELLVPYALDELDELARRQVERALVDDTELRAELASVERTCARIVQATTPGLTAPDRLRARVLAAAVPVPATTARRHRRRAWIAPTLAGAAVAASVVLAVGLVDVRGELDATREQLDALRSEPRSTDGMAAVRPVSIHERIAPAHGSLVRVGDALLLVMDDMPAPGDGSSWQVWTTGADGTRTNVSQWTSASSVQVAVVGDADDVREVMVSHERGTGAMPAPSGEPMATATMPV